MYRFRLQRVLEYRRRREEDQQQALRQAQRLHDSEATRLDECRQAAQEHEDALVAAYGAAHSSAEWHLWQRHYSTLAQSVEAQQDVVTQVAQQVAARRQQLLMARQETKAIEKLDEKARQRYQATLAQQENQLLDELALTRSRHGH